MMTEKFRATENGAVYPFFDWLRFFLASAVVFSHLGVFSWIHAGNLPVQIFFALSGWLIGGILLRASKDELPRFFYNRSTRIWIPYFLAVAAVYILAALRDGWSYTEFLFYDLTFTHNWFIDKVPAVLRRMPLEGTGAGFWSIAVEEQFYLAAPLMIVLLNVGKNVLPWVVIALLAYFTHSWYGSITLGVLAAVIQNKFGNWHLTGKIWGIGARRFLIVAALLSAAGLNLFYEWFAPIFAVSTVLLLAIPSCRKTRHGIAVFFGGISYPLYLNHWIGTFLAHELAFSPLLTVAVAYIIAVIVASVAYIAVDVQVQRYRGRFFTRGRGRAFAALAYTVLALGVLGGLFFFEHDVDTIRKVFS